MRRAGKPGNPCPPNPNLLPEGEGIHRLVASATESPLSQRERARVGQLQRLCVKSCDVATAAA